MVKLDYQTQNRRWGWSGMEYSTWIDYAFGLGYLSNEQHYRNKYNGPRALIEVHVEGNHVQGAWGKEGRIQYYGTRAFLSSNFPDWDAMSSQGTGSITRRMNSNDYIYSLVSDYGFQRVSYPGYTTEDIFPPAGNVKDSIFDTMIRKMPRNVPDDVNSLEDAFNAGWNL